MPNMTKDNTLNKKALYSLLSAQRSFGQAHSSATFILEEVEDGKSYSLADRRKFQCFETTLIIAYTRPFKSSNGTNKLSIENNLNVSLTETELELHNKILFLRDSIIAHSDKKHLKMSVINLQDKGRDFLLPRFDESLYLTISEIELVMDILYNFINNSMKSILSSYPLNLDDLNLINIDLSD